MCIGVDLLVEQPLSVETLSSLVELTRFETLTPRFSATVPPCWVEVQQEQQQRRHPQHLHQQHHGDAAQHTRTWKLQSDRFTHFYLSLALVNAQPILWLTLTVSHVTAPAGTSMCSSWSSPKPAWWDTWISSLCLMPVSPTFLRSRSRC